MHTGLSGPGVTCHLPSLSYPFPSRTAYRGADCSCERPEEEGMAAGLLCRDLVSERLHPALSGLCCHPSPPGSFCAQGPALTLSPARPVLPSAPLPSHLSLLRRPAGPTTPHPCPVPPWQTSLIHPTLTGLELSHHRAQGLFCFRTPPVTWPTCTEHCREQALFQVLQVRAQTEISAPRLTCT